MRKLKTSLLSQKMEKIGREKLIWSVMILSCSAAIVFLFQNCTQPVTGSDQTSTAAASADFAYETTVDQIAYMSCSNMAVGSYDTSAYFTLRAGAYRNAGVALNSTFQAAYPKSTADYKSSILQASAANNATTIQLAIRQINSYQNISTQSSGTSTQGLDYDNLFTNLGESAISDALAGSASGATIRYLRNEFVTGARMEGSIRFNANAGLMSSVRTSLANGNYLTLTYSNNNAAGTAATLARSPADLAINASAKIDANRVIYGHGFAISYGLPSSLGTIDGSVPLGVMTAVTEYDLQNISNRTNTKSWSCPATMQFRIVQRLDLAKTGANCVLKPDPPTLSADLALVRNSLKVEDWYVDMANKCIVPKKAGTGCYGTSTTVNYNLASACDSNLTSNLCTSFASVCLRN